MKKHYPPITLGSPGEEISTKDLYAIIQRFKNLNQYRLLCVQDFLQPRQRVFLPLLPLIFHQNHPLLPGFISTETAAGIPDYAPHKGAVLAAKQFSKNYRYTRKALRNHTIEGLFLMGSVGSIAFSKSSDMDIWLCYSPTLTEEEIDELQQKACAVEKWAESLNLEVHFFLINSEQFRRGENAPISSESSGQTQHYLLLEEFYRTAIYLAGKAPAWWIVPPQQEHNYNAYIHHLLENRFISHREVIDFGGLESVPAEEFISATLWHIYKSLSSPYKSLLKLFLMECYASEYPRPQWISHALKKAIYQGDFNIDRLDPYLLIYEKVEEYLNLVASQKRLALSRQCFYLKIMGSTQGALDAKSRVIREQYMRNIARDWHWPYDMLENFSKHRYWNIHKAIQEHAVIRDQLKQCLRMTLRFAGQHVEEDYHHNLDLKLIGRKLHAVLEQKTGKVEIITTRSGIHKHEDAFTIIEVDQAPADSLWYLHCGSVNDHSNADAKALKVGHSLLELLSWLVFNGLYRYAPRIHLKTHSLNIGNAGLQQILNQLQLFFTSEYKSTDDSLETYNHPNQLVTSLLFINLGESLPEDRKDGQIVMSHRSDPLSYGENRVCFIQRVDRVSISTWGEITTAQYQGCEVFFRCLIDMFNLSRTPLTAESMHLVCHTPLRANSIALRIKAVYGQLLRLFADKQSSWRYILPSQTHYCLFMLQQGQLTYWQLETNDMLLQELSESQKRFAPVHFDEHVLSNTFIPFVYSHINEDTIQVFYHASDTHVAVYVIDEHAALFTRQYVKTKPEHVLADYVAFLHTLNRQNRLRANIGIRFFEIQKNSAGVCSCHAVKVNTADSLPILHVRVVAAQADENSASPAILCNDKEFSAATSDDPFADARAYILTYRNFREEYPFRINSIDVPARFLGLNDLADARTVHFLQYKHKVESRLMDPKTH